MGLSDSLGKKKLVALAVVGIIVIAGLAALWTRGGFGRDNPCFELSYDSVKSPPSGPLMVTFDPDDIKQVQGSIVFVPLASGAQDNGTYRPLFFSAGDEVGPAVSKYQPNEVDVGGLGHCLGSISIGVADKYWEKIDVAVVVKDYFHAVLAAPLASYLNAPLLFYCDDGDTQAFIDEKGIPSVVIVGKGVELEGVGQVTLRERDDVWSFYLDTLRDGDGCDYVVVANPYDADYGNESYYVHGISLAGAVLASERHALVAAADYTVDKNLTFQLGYGTADAGSGERGEDPDTLTDEQEIAVQSTINFQAIAIDNDIDEAVAAITGSGGEAKYVALAGDQASVPMLYLKSPVYYEEVDQEEKGEEYTATDLFYGDLDIKLTATNETREANYDYMEDVLYQQELHAGRIIGPNALDSSALVARSLAYWDYEWDGETSVTAWSNRGVIVNSLVVGDSDSMAATHQQAVFTENGMIVEKEHPLEAWKIRVFDEQGAVRKMENANAIIYDGHGYPDGWYWLWTSTHDNEEDFDRIGSEDVWPLELHATPVFGACCLSSALDWPVVWSTSDNRQDMTPDKIIALSFIHAGALGYIGATEESWGSFFGGLADGNPDAWGYGDFDLPTLFWQHIFDGCTQGEALTNARMDFFRLQSNPDAMPFTRVCELETVLYGDPAAEFWHEGAL